MRTCAILALLLGILCGCGGGDPDTEPADAPASGPTEKIDPPPCAAHPEKCT